jgi:sulfonate transport system permease protein
MPVKIEGSGIGNTLIDGSEHFMMDLVLFGMIVIGLVGWALNLLARRLEQRMQRLYGIAPR